MAAVDQKDKLQGAGAPSWLTRKHPDYTRWVNKEAKQRASYVATLELLIPYLVPHRFETEDKTKDNKDLPRARLGFGFKLNAAYLAEIFGHIRQAARVYFWGPLSEATEENTAEAGRPAGGVAQQLWDDATLSNVTWSNFFQRTVLEWILSAPGGFIIADVPPGKAESQKEEQDAGKRPYFRFISMSSVEDLGRGDNGFRWLKILEEVDERGVKDDRDKGISVHRLIYELDEDTGSTFVTRYDKDGEPVPIVTGEGKEVSEVDMGAFVDRQGHTTLPVIYASYGEDAIVPWLGGALLDGLDDIVLDIYNTYSEVREGYRDVAFGFLAYKGTDAKQVRDQLADGSRFVHVGEGDDDTLDRVAAESAETMAGIQLIDLAIRAWALSAKRKAEEAADSRAQGPRSGISIRAEFELDLVPLLVDISGHLDSIESDCMHIAAQLADKNLDGTEDEVRAIKVETNKDFRPEDEASRITRLAGDFLRDVTSNIPVEAMVDILEKWAEASDIFDMEREVELADGTTVTMREYIRLEGYKIFEAQERGVLLGAQQPVPGGITV